MEEILKQIELIETMQLDTRTECFMQLQQVKKLKKLVQQQLKILNIPVVVGRSEQLKALLEILLQENMCSVIGDELIEEVLKGF